MEIIAGMAAVEDPEVVEDQLMEGGVQRDVEEEVQQEVGVQHVVEDR